MKRGKLILKYIFTLIYLYLSYVYMPIDNEYKFEEILTFLSITLGFAFTGMSLISGSEFSKKLYERESKKDNSTTQLHELVNIYFSTSKWFIINSILIILFNMFRNSLQSNYVTILNIELYKLLYIIIIYFTLICCHKFYELIILFKNQVIQSVT